MEPQVSVPMANGNNPAAVAEAEPAEDPLEVEGAQTDVSRHLLEGGTLGPMGLEIGECALDTLVVAVLFVCFHNVNVGHVRDPIHPVLAFLYWVPPRRRNPI